MFPYYLFHQEASGSNSKMVRGFSTRGGGGLEGNSSNDFQPPDQLPGVECGVSSNPSWTDAIILGFQHYLISLGNAIITTKLLVPVMGGEQSLRAELIQTMVFVSGINTLLQCFFGTRLPVVMGPSFTYLVPTLAISLSARYQAIGGYYQFLSTMKAIQGAQILASFFQIIIGFLRFRRGSWFRLLCPLTAVPLISLTGLGFYQYGFSLLADCIEIGLPQLILMVFISQYLPRMLSRWRGISCRYAVLFTVATGWAYAHILTISGAYDKKKLTTQVSCRTDLSGLLTATPWIKVPHPFQWGTPTFHVGEAFAMMSASLVTLIESSGTFIAVSRYASATPVPPSVLSRGIGWQGTGLLLDGLFGTVIGSAASAENTGLLAMTRVGSQRVIQIAALFMLFFSVIGKFGALFASIPVPIVAAMYFILNGYVASAGLGLLQYVNLNSFRTKFVLGFSLLIGIAVPQYFLDIYRVLGHYPVNTGSTAFNSSVNVIFSSKATTAFIVAVILNNTMDYNDDVARNDSGYCWWERSRSFKTDKSSQEYYTLPFNLHKYFY